MENDSRLCPYRPLSILAEYMSIKSFGSKRDFVCNASLGPVPMARWYDGCTELEDDEEAVGSGCGPLFSAGLGTSGPTFPVPVEFCLDWRPE